METPLGFTNLDFDDTLKHSKSSNSERDINNFMNFVDRVLHLHDLPNIHKFSLKCLYTDDESRINAWISTALKRKVQDIFLDLKPAFPVLPISFFTCETLKTVEIAGVKLTDGYLYKIPNLIRWSSLKVLHLDSLKFICDTSNHLSLYCPVLEKFTVLKAVCNARELTLSLSSIAVISHSDHLDHMRAFSSLIILKVAQSGNWTIVQLLQMFHLPNVELLLFQNGFSRCGFAEREDGGALDVIPQRNLLCLESVKLEHFLGSANELYLVNFLLKNAVAFGKMTVISSLKLSEDPKKQLEVTKKLLLHRGSSCSEIEFS
ncbi:hypothetical protein IFM89_035719 [Coptis chinensis]|uniref:FBD domain-containing protein n=1 Tax=Coptis chinensis TaxID=261450 RepID=A0A835GZK6_9MAGN|nr:hypothetical protein IFM89_035719 [Coptis chinensis]